MRWLASVTSVWCSVGRVWRMLGLVWVVVVVAAGVWVISASASASSPLQFEPEPEELRAFSTRVHLVETLQTGGSEASWQGEYAPAEGCPTNCHPPKEGWILAGSGKTEEFAGKFVNSTYVFLGTVPSAGATSLAVLHGLIPSTVYYARFHAENTNKEQAESLTFSFTTEAAAKPEVTEFRASATSPRSARASSEVESNGAPSKYCFEYAPEGTPEGSPTWVAFGCGTVEEFGRFEAKIPSGLLPETAYCARLTVTNLKGTTVARSFGPENGCFMTPTEKPVFGTPELRNATGESVRVSDNFSPHELETSWRLEYATSESGPWVKGPEGVVSQAQAGSLPEGVGVVVVGSLTGLLPGTTYYVRIAGENAAGSAESGVASFRTFGALSAVTLGVHGLHGEALRVMGGVNPDSVPTSAEQVVALEGAPTGGSFTLTFKGETTLPIAFDASAGDVEKALDELSAIRGEVGVSGLPGGPYTVFFRGGVAEPAITGDGSGLIPSSGVKVSVVLAGGEAYDTHYHFEYVSQKQFEAPGSEGGFAKAAVTPEEDLGSGINIVYVGVDLPQLVGGETYRYRIVARSTSPGEPVVDGETQTLTVPAAVEAGVAGSSACPNAAVRTGLSARLPDCRAYEQLTPVEKKDAQEIFNYGSSVGGGSAAEGALPGRDGDHLEFGSLTVKWGSGARVGQSPYFFSRTGNGWQMTAGTVQPEAGIYHYTGQVFSPNLDEFALEANWRTSPSLSDRASHIEFKTGAPGGPYAVLPAVPAGEEEPGWVASSADFSKLILQVADHTLLGHSTHTVAGDDLYEYAGGQLRQVNVSSTGVTIGSCGARIAAGFVEGLPGFNGSSVVDGARAVSGDGSRVFFEAVPGACGETAEHVYMRVSGGGEAPRTMDVGAYRFVAADAEGTNVLLEKSAGENPGLYLYKSDSGVAEFLPGSGVAASTKLTVSEDLSTVYIQHGDGEQQGDFDLYRYDVAGGDLLFVSHLEVDEARRFFQASPDGRYFYFIAAGVAGLPAGGEELKTPGAAQHGRTSQVFRYDSSESMVQCVSCASPSDPEPLLSALFTERGGTTVASADGDYVFFDTPAALLPADVDGQIAPEGVKGEGGQHGSLNYSLSSDVYEWRRQGIGGCVPPQGCLALITTGGGGFLNLLLGTTASGRDVFFATDESLLRSDNDTASDIYDARVGGGFAEPASPVVCEGDSCAIPFAAPNDTTPSSSSFRGAGNPPQAKPNAKPHKTRVKLKRRCKAKTRHGSCKAKSKKADKTNKHATRHTKRTGGRGK